MDYSADEIREEFGTIFVLVGAGDLMEGLTSFGKVQELPGNMSGHKYAFKTSDEAIAKSKEIQGADYEPVIELLEGDNIRLPETTYDVGDTLVRVVPKGMNVDAPEIVVETVTAISSVKANSMFDPENDYELRYHTQTSGRKTFDGHFVYQRESIKIHDHVNTPDNKSRLGRYFDAADEAIAWIQHLRGAHKSNLKEEFTPEIDAQWQASIMAVREAFDEDVELQVDQDIGGQKIDALQINADDLSAIFIDADENQMGYTIAFNAAETIAVRDLTTEALEAFIEDLPDNVAERVKVSVTARGAKKIAESEVLQAAFLDANPIRFDDIQKKAKPSSSKVVSTSAAQIQGIMEEFDNRHFHSLAP